MASCAAWNSWTDSYAVPRQAGMTRHCQAGSVLQWVQSADHANDSTEGSIVNEQHEPADAQSAGLPSPSVATSMGPGRPRLEEADSHPQAAGRLLRAALEQLQDLAQQYQVTDKQAADATACVSAMVHGGFICRQYGHKSRVRAVADSGFCWRTVEQAAAAVAGQALRAVMDNPQQRRHGNTVIDDDSEDGKVPRPPEESFHFRYSHTSIPVKENDVFDMNVGRPEQTAVPLYVYRELP